MEYDMKSVVAQIEGINKGITDMKGLATDMDGMKSAIAQMQTDMKKWATPSETAQVCEGVKEMIEYMRGTKAATIANPASGGYFAVPEYVGQVVLKMGDRNPIISETDVINVSGNIAYLPYETSEPVAKWVGETETRTDTDIGLGVANIPVNDCILEIKASNDLLADGNIADVEKYLVDRATAQLAKKVGSAILTGTGFNSPKGILNDTRVGTVNCLASTAFDTDAIFDIIAGVPEEALDNAKWYLSMDTFLAIAKSFGKDSDYCNMPLGDGVPASIMGYPVVICAAPKFSTATSNAIIGAFGDLRQAYKTIQRSGLEYQRDPYTAASNNMTVCRFKTRIGGALVDPDAIVGIKYA